MHPLFKKADELSRQAIGAAIEVHRLKGPGLAGKGNDSTEGSEGSEGDYLGIYLQIARKDLLCEPGEDFCHAPPGQNRFFSELTSGGFRI
jgi:hypothetical protein